MVWLIFLWLQSVWEYCVPTNLNYDLKQRIRHFKQGSHNIIGTRILIGVSLRKYDCCNFFITHNNIIKPQLLAIAHGRDKTNFWSNENCGKYPAVLEVS